jgi:hypothetical protein
MSPAAFAVLQIILEKNEGRKVDQLKRLRDAVLGREDREVQVTPSGEVRPIEIVPREPRGADEPPKATKLAARTFGAPSSPRF